MSTGTINFEDYPDDDENQENLNEGNLPEEATDFNPEEFGDAPLDKPEEFPELDVKETANTEEFKSVEELKKAPTEKQIEAQVQKEINALKREAKQELAATKKELKKQFRREVRDEAKANRRERKALNREATQRRKEIRSIATQNRIGTYALASAFGAKGYVIASAIDTLVFRPEEERAIEQERAYTDQVEAHFQQAEDELQQRKDDFEDQLDAMRPEDIDEDAIRNKYQASASSPPGTPGGGNAGTSTPSSQTNNTGFAPPPSGSPPSSQPPLPPPQSNPPYNNPPPPPTPPPNNPPTNNPPPPPGPPPIPPTPSSGSNLAGTAALVTLAMEVGKVITDGVNNLGDRARENVKATFSDKPSDFIRQQSKNLEMLEPVTNLTPMTTMANLVMQNAVEVFAEAVDKFDEYSRKNLAFSPEALTKSIEGQINKLVSNMEIAQRLDAAKARNLAANDRLAISFEEFKARVFTFFEPFMTGITNFLNGILMGINFLISVAEALTANIPVIRAIFALLRAQQQKSLHQTVVDRQEQFLNAAHSTPRPNRRRGNP